MMRDIVNEARELADGQILIPTATELDRMRELLRALADEVESLHGLRCPKCKGETYMAGYSKVHKQNDSLNCPNSNL